MKVEIFVCNDGLEAKLSIRDFDPKEWRACFRDKANLVSHLVTLGLPSHMLEDAAVESVCALLADESPEPGMLAMNLKEVHSLAIASGQSPKDEEAEGLMFHKTYLSEPGEIANLERSLRDSGLEVLKKSVDPGCLVEAGQVILSFMSINAGQAGKDVFGKPIPSNDYTRMLPKAGRGIVKLDKKWVSKNEGILVLARDTLTIMGEGPDQTGLIRVSDDKLKAWLVLQSDVMSYSDNSKSGLKHIKSVMAKMGLRPIRDEGKVLSALESFQSQGLETEILVLEGNLPKPGKDGALELLMNPEPDLPDPEVVKNVDFKEFSFFRSVLKGNPLARIHPPEAGLGGMTVYGDITLAKPGSPIQFVLGANTEFSVDDPNLILASRDGRLALESGIPFVVDTLRVDKDVSFRTGNLTFPGSIEVAGNVLDKFVINAKGDVGIGGVVENGVVVSEGAILIKGGVIGGGNGLIKSRLSSVTIGYIRNQRIESHSNIVVYNEVLNGQLLARKSILMKSASHSVIGGHLVAFDGIEVFNSGNEAGTKTILEVGKDFEIETELFRKQDQLKAVRTDLEFLEKKRHQLELIVRWEAGKKPENRLLMQRVKGVLTFLEKVRKTLVSKMNELEAMLHNPGDCHILVSGTAFPGTILKHRDKVIPVTEPMQNKRWLFKAGQ